MNNAWLRALFFVWIIFWCGCGRNEKFLAEVSGQKISAEEFKERYKKYLSSTSVRDNILVRKQILNNMISEVLILNDVKRQGFDKDSAAAHRLNEARAQAIMLRYAQQLTLDTMTVTDEELKNEFRHYNTKAHARYLYAATEDSAWELKDAIEQGATFETLAKIVFQDPGLANNGGDLGFFGWSEMEPALEEFAFTQPVGTLSDPIKLRMGYAIVKLEDRTYQPLASEYDFSKVKDKLETAIEKRKIVNYLKDVTGKIRKELLPAFKEDAVHQLFGMWQSLIDQPTASSPETKQTDIRPLTIATFNTGIWTIGDVLKRLPETKLRQRKRVKTTDDLKEFIIGIATREITFQRAMAAGLESDSLVQNQIMLTMQEYLLTRWKNSVQDTAGKKIWDEALLQHHYNEKKSQYIVAEEINVGEILLRTKDDGNKIMKQLQHGANFTSTARKNSLRLWAAKRGGELGFGPKSMYGQLADTLFKTEAGKILGPLQADPYWGIFKIIEKHNTRVKSFDEAKENVIKEILFSHGQEVFKQAVTTLQHNANIVINDELLVNINLN